MKDVFKMESEEFSLGSKNISFQFVEIHMELSEVSSALDNGTVLILLNIQHLKRFLPVCQSLLPSKPASMILFVSDKIPSSTFNAVANSIHIPSVVALSENSG